jgi:hypothetical protein
MTLGCLSPGRRLAERAAGLCSEAALLVGITGSARRDGYGFRTGLGAKAATRSGPIEPHERCHSVLLYVVFRYETSTSGTRPYPRQQLLGSSFRPFSQAFQVDPRRSWAACAPRARAALRAATRKWQRRNDGGDGKRVPLRPERPAWVDSGRFLVWVADRKIGHSSGGLVWPMNEPASREGCGF